MLQMAAAKVTTSDGGPTWADIRPTCFFFFLIYFSRADIRDSIENLLLATPGPTSGRHALIRLFRPLLLLVCQWQRFQKKVEPTQ